MPNAGFTGTDVANIWLARVGAANSLTQQAGNVQSAAALAKGAAWSSAMGGASVNLNQAVDLGKKIFGSTETSTGISGGGAGAAMTGADTSTAGADWSS
jgi:hypothetical protein